MNEHPASQQWNPILANPGEDFADFLDLGDLNFSYFPEENTEVTENDEGRQRNGGEIMDHTMGEAVGLLGMRGRDHAGVEGQQQTIQNEFLQSTPTGPFTAAPTSYGQYAQHPASHHQQQWVAPNMVPPTPGSMELHAGHSHNYPAGLDIQQQQLYEHYRRIQKDQVNFTPLISPAVTPLETQARYPEYAHDAFSPLTSPALRAQSHANGHSAYGSVRGSDTSATTSPHDLTHEYPAQTSASTSSVRRSRRKMSTSSTKNSARTVKQSPAMKPQHKKKQTSSTVIPPKEVATVLEEASSGMRPDQTSFTSNGSILRGDDSMTESMSPEALSDILMPPPATPQSSSAGRSPQLDAMAGHPKPLDDQSEEPATPASLMRLRKQAQQASGRRRGLSKSKHRDSRGPSDKDESMEGVELSGSSTSENNEIRPSSMNGTSGKISITRASRPTSIPISAPATAVSSALPSPITTAFTSPPTFKAVKSLDNKPKVRDPKKRGSGPSEKASPAIRPRISPSIKPLLPEGTTVSPETSALLLASKSNYQNILEGTHFPGVSYPETLSTNLTSKRTSHKIAEQGRRNRINTALQDIAALLPTPTASSPISNTNGVGNDRPGEGGGENRGKGGPAGGMSPAVSAQQQSNSKASTVEAAIDYIKALQNEVMECKVKIADLEARNAGSPAASKPATASEAGEMLVDGGEKEERKEKVNET